jgi:hypothetical protein
MEVIKTAYRIRFNLEFELMGMHDDLNQYLKLLSDHRTKIVFADFKILERKQKSASVSLIEVEHSGSEKGKPKVIPSENEMFRFQIKLAETSFIRRTHLASYDFTNEVLYFSNAVNHVEGPEILLSLPIENYNGANTYKPGYLVRSGGSFYKAIQESNNSNQHPVSDGAYWKGISDGTFVSHADLRARTSLTEPVDLDTIIVVEIKHSAALHASYQLLDGAFKCREVSYKIKLLTAN